MKQDIIPKYLRYIPEVSFRWNRIVPHGKYLYFYSSESPIIIPQGVNFEAVGEGTAIVLGEYTLES